MRFRKKPDEIDAELYDPGASGQPCVRRDKEGRHYVVTKDGECVLLRTGDWIISDGDGSHAVAMPGEEFARKYEPVIV